MYAIRKNGLKNIFQRGRNLTFLIEGVQERSVQNRGVFFFELRLVILIYMFRSRGTLRPFSLFFFKSDVFLLLLSMVKIQILSFL